MPASDFRSILGKSIQSLFEICFVLMMLGVMARGQGGNTTLTDGQTPLGLQPGAPAGAYALSGLDNINLFNGNLNFRLPLMQIGGRGGAQMTMTLPIEVKWRVFHLFTPEIPPNPPSHTYLPFPSAWNPIQPGYGPGVLIGRKAGTEADCGTVIPPHIRYTLTRLTFIGADGTEYELRDQLTQGKPADLGGAACFGGSNFGRGKVFVTADGSAMTFISDQPISDAVVYSEFYYPTGYLFFRDGTRFRIEEGLVKRLTDRNGNRLDFTYDDQYHQLTVITDSLNRSVEIAYAETLDGYDEISWKGSQGSPRSIKVWRGLLGNHLRSGTAEGSSGYSLKTLHELFPQIPGLDNTNDFDWPVLSSVELPDGRRYRFYYNNYAELARVELPTGGAYEYDFTPTSGVLWVEAIHRRVVERRVYPDGLTLEGKTTYADTDLGNNTEVDVNHRDRNGTLLGREKHYFNSTAALSMSPAIEAVCYGAFLDGKEFLTESYDTSGNVLRILEQNYAQREPVPWWSTWQGPACLGEPPNDTRLIVATTTLTDVTPNLVAQQTFAYDQFNNVTDTCDYDFGSGATGALLRHARTTYVVSQFNNTDYTTFDLVNPASSIHLRSLPLSQIVNTSCTDNQTALAKTEYEYDNYTGEGGTNPDHAALEPRSNISGHDDAVFSTARTARGNVTSVKSWIDSTTSASTFQFYDSAGNVVKSKDALGNSTLFDFSDRFGFPDDESRNNVQAPVELGPQTTYAFPTNVTNALGHTAYTQFDYYLGRPINGEDPNGIVTKGRFDDSLDRPTQLVVAENVPSVRRRSLITYDDSTHLMTTQSDQTAFQDGAIKTETAFDGFGRKLESRGYESSSAYITSKLEFDALGRVKRAFNAFRATPDETSGWTVTSYDALSRVARVETFDGAGTSTGAIVTTDLGNATTVIDQAGRKRRSLTDALGRLVRVDEPDSSGNLDNGANPPQPLQPTLYVYDALDDLVKVTQGGQSRFFSYDKLTRLIRVRTPEQGINNNLAPALTDPVTGNNQWCAKYVYDANSNLLTRTDARDITTTYTHDALNRITSRSYSANDPQSTPPVSYKYDAQSLAPGFPSGFNRGFSTGRLVAVTYGATSAGAYIGYDQLGRVISSYQQTLGQNYGFTYGYNIAGEMMSQIYPSGRTINLSYDLAGRPTGLNGQKTGESNRAYLSQFSYSPQGSVSSVTLGNNLIERTTYNSRLQPTLVKLGTTSNSASVVQLGYTYGIVVGGALDTSKNNGNVQSQTVTVGASVIKQTYVYDSLNRLQSAAEEYNQTPKWTQSYVYDRFGNRTSLLNTGADGPLLPTSSTPSIDSATNRINQPGFVYDPAGDLKQEPGKSYDYDAENRQVKFNNGAVTYSYDGDGRRVKRVVAGPPVTTTLFVYNAAGQLIAEYTDATSSSPGGTSYLTTDHLGSTRVVTNANGSVVSRHDYLPFGEDIPAQVAGRPGIGGYGVADGLRQKFTEKERDSESGLDYFLARYYSSTHGRFTSADPKLDSGTPIQPQGWNRYSYVINNPLNHTDPDGLDWWYLPGTSPIQPVWFDKDPGGKWQRFTELSGGSLIYQIGYGPDSGKWVALDPFSRRSYVSANLGDAIAAYRSFVSGRFGLIPGTEADRDFWAGFSEGISGWAGMLVNEINEKLAGVDTDSRDYKGGYFIGALVLAGVNITADLVQSIRKTGSMDPSKIRFSQKTINNTFTDLRGIDTLADGLRTGNIKPGDVKPVRLVVKDGHLFTLDNRRLWAFRKAGVPIPCRMATPKEAASESWKFTTTNGGISVRVRGRR